MRLCLLFLRLAALWCLALLALPAPSRAAEGDSSVMSWRVVAPVQRAAPVRRPTQTYRARKRYDAPRLKQGDDAAPGLHAPDLADTVPPPPDAPRVKIAVVGDSLADALAAGLEADPGFQADMTLRSKIVSASGLVRADFHDWPPALAALIGENPDLVALVVMVGLNDRQPIREGAESLEPMTEPWIAAYRKRVDAVIQAGQNAHVPIIWVGLPVVRSTRLSSDLVRINEIIRERVTAAGETYVETYESFAEETGGFAASGPDIIGDTVRLRGPDGIHFTPAGQRKLAFFVTKPLRKRIGDKIKPAAPNAVATLPNVGPSSPATGGDFTIPLPGPAELALPQPRPDIGEIRPLLEPASASALVARKTPPLTDPATRALFDRGLSPPSRAGRSDDFRWR